MTVGSITQKNPFITVFIGDFDAKSLKWCTDDKTAQESLNIENFLSQFSLSQVINKPTHVSQKLNFFTNPSFHCDCHYQIICGKFNLKIFYPPPYERHILHYKHVNVDMVSMVFDWNKAFLDKSTDKKLPISRVTLF